MSTIRKQDTEGTKPLLGTGELGFDNYPVGGDAGRVYVGTGSTNVPLARKDELPVVATTEVAGLVEKAITTEAIAGTADKFPDAAGVKAHVDSRGTSSPIDATIGKFLKVGDGGLMQPRAGTGTLDSSENINGMRSAIWGTDAPADRPAGSTLAGKLFVIGDEAYPTQIWFEAYLNRLWVRGRLSANAAFREWSEIYHTGNTGTAVNYDVTTDTNSSTAGALTKVGDYGNGRIYPSSSITGVDFHALPESSYFNGVSGKNGVFASSGSSNTPPKGSFWWIEVIMLEGGSCRMMATSHNAFGTSEERTVFFKDRVGGIGGIWSSWTEVITTASILGTVGWDAAGGIPSGAVMERGANINGEYVKLADGTVINHVAYAQAYTAFTDYVYTLPHALITTANAGITLSVEPNSVFDTEAQAWLGANTYLIFRSKTEAVGQNTLRFTVIGRWR